MRSTTGIIAAAVGTVVALILVLVLVVLPSSDSECGPGRVVPPPPTGDCAPTGSAAEAGLTPTARKVLRCVAAHFPVKHFVGVEEGGGDHASGRAVDFLLDGRDGVPSWSTDDGKSLGDDIVAFLRDNAHAFAIAYVIWRERSWTPDPDGAGAGAWQPLPDRGSAAANRMDRVQVTTLAPGAAGADPSLAAQVAPPDQDATTGGVDDAGHLVPTTARHVPIAGAVDITDGFGSRGGEHQGVDFGAPEGTPVLAAADGKVVAAGPAAGFGNWIVIDSLDPDGVPFSTVYGHMAADGIRVHVGESVTAGEHIADVGSAGESTGPHLHFEVVPGGRLTGGEAVDPVAWLKGAPITGSRLPPLGDIECYNGFGSAGGNLADGTVPRELAVWYRRAGSLCPEITPSLLAAQGKQESGFQRGLVSPAGAEGLAQFLPGTAAATDPDDGQPYVIDADGSGQASLWDDADAIVGQGRYMCHLARQIEQWKSQGKVTGDTTALALAAYNAGLGAVLESGGMPDLVPAHFSETRPYVRNILSMEPSFRARGDFGEFEPDRERPGAGDVLSAVRQWLGTPYVFGGGGPEGPTGGGFDMAGLTAAAVATATGGAVTLPRTVEEQWGVGTEVPMSRVRPGDLVFGDFGPSGPSTVGVYAGNRSMVVAESGGAVTQVPLESGMRARRMQ